MQHQLVSHQDVLTQVTIYYIQIMVTFFFLNSYVQNICTILLSANTLTSTSQAFAQFFFGNQCVHAE